MLIYHSLKKLIRFKYKQEEHSSSTAITYSSNKNKRTRTMNTYHWDERYIKTL